MNKDSSSFFIVTLHRLLAKLFSYAKLVGSLGPVETAEKKERDCL
jgi:hypothetical protein